MAAEQVSLTALLHASLWSIRADQPPALGDSHLESACMFQNINIRAVYAPLILAIHSNRSFYGKSELALGVETVGNTQESAVLHVRAGSN